MLSRNPVFSVSVATVYTFLRRVIRNSRILLSIALHGFQLFFCNATHIRSKSREIYEDI